MNQLMKKEKVLSIIKDIQNSKDIKKVNYSKARVIPYSMQKIMVKL